jgi:hypothetical protein
MFFEKQVDTRSRQTMVGFLASHFRYPTNHSWAQTTYANRVKIPYLGLTRHQENRAYDMLRADYWNQLQVVIDKFTSEMDGKYTIANNGRYSGYLVLLHGEYYQPGYKSRCRACGQLHFQAVIGEEVGQCGSCCRLARVNLSHPVRRHRALGLAIDQDLNFEDLSMSELRERVELVRSFDRACDNIRSAFIDLLDHCKVVEETVMVPKTVRRLVCAAAA